MSIPGLGLAVPIVSRPYPVRCNQIANKQQPAFSAPTTTGAVAVHELQANSEWRFEVAMGRSIEVKVSQIRMT